MQRGHPYFQTGFLEHLPHRRFDEGFTEFHCTAGESPHVVALPVTALLQQYPAGVICHDADGKVEDYGGVPDAGAYPGHIIHTRSLPFM